MKIQEKKKHTPLVHQLTGILPADADVEQEYGRYLEEKYEGTPGTNTEKVGRVGRSSQAEDRAARDAESERC